MKAVVLILCLILAACAPAPARLSAPANPLSGELVIYAWAEYIPAGVLDAFTERTGVTVRYIAYASSQDAYHDILNEKPYDLVLLPAEWISPAIQSGQLTEMDYTRLPNARNISPNFRDLAFDPGNHYSIPFYWGTTGLLVRTDLITHPVTGWKDMWAPEYAGRVVQWYAPREIIAITLISLGYPANSVDRSHLEAAYERLLELKTNSYFINYLEPSILPELISGRAVVATGYAYDAVLARQMDLPVEFILPEEGPLLWSESFVIPRSAPNPRAALAFLNFIYEPAYSAQIINEGFYAMPSDAATLFIDPDLAADPAVYPPVHKLRNAEMLQTLTPENQRLYDDLWQRLEIAEP